MSRRQLLELYTQSGAGPIPDGRARGVALIAPGTPLNGILAALTRLFGWQGKILDARHGRLYNCITPFRISAIPAEVYQAPSLVDGKPCIVLDYSRTSTLARLVRDEIRNVAENVYLGFAYWSNTRLIAFALDFTPT